MKNKTAFKQIEDLLENDSFVQWATGETARDSIFWEQWKKANPDKTEMLEDAIAMVKGLSFKLKDISSNQVDTALHQLNSRIDTNTSTNSVRQRFRWSRIAIAASIAILTCIGVGLLYADYQDMESYSTAYGEWQTIELPDGSTVKLNADSELEFAKNWNEGEVREVWLKGEAFFDVVKMLDQDTEFKVITSDLDVEVLGTSFNVKARGEKTEVYLEEGKVKLDLGSRITYMDPGDVISYSARQEKIVDRRRRTSAAIPSPSSWKEGVIEMRDSDAFDILNKIEEIYGVTMSVRNKDIYDDLYQVQLPMKELDIVIPILEKSMGLKITKQSDKIFFVD